jgi:hypothetical protein
MKIDTYRWSRNHFGLITASVALAAGYTQEQIDGYVERGEWERRHPTVYAVAGAPRSWRQDLQAAHLASEGVASHRAALALWDLPGGSEITELSVDRPRHPKIVGALIHRSTDLRPFHVVIKDSIPCTRPARTLVDAGAVLHWKVVERATDEALGRRLVTLEEVHRVFLSLARKGRRGIGALRAVLERRGVDDSIPESVLEGWFRRLYIDSGLPVPEDQFEVLLGARLYRLDRAYPELRIAIEIDGYRSHSSLEAFQSDRARQNDLVTAGWIVLRFTWDDVLRRGPAVIETIRQAIEQQLRLLGRVSGL